MSGHFSFMPAYWHVFDIQAARAMLRVRLDVACNEGAARSRPITFKQLDGQHRVVERKDRIDDRAGNVRAIYVTRLRD